MRNVSRSIALALGFLIPSLVAAGSPPPPAPASPPASWTDATFSRLAAQEFRFKWNDGVLQAPNRAHGFRTIAGDDGFSIVSRTKGAAAFTLELRLVSFGRSSSLAPVLRGQAVEENGRAEIRRRGITEWLENDPRGIEHGIRIDRPPVEPGSGVVLSFKIGGDVLAYPEGTESVLFKDGRGAAVVRYGELSVRDASQKTVPARMSIWRGELRFEIDDRGAVYPLSVDPLATSPQWELFLHQDGARLGSSVAAAGDVNGDGYSDVLVAAQHYDDGEADEGKVFLYLGGPSGLSTAPAWSAQTNQASAYICSVGAAGDVNGDGHADVIVGSCYYDAPGPKADAGAAFMWYGGVPGLFNPSGLGPDGTPANADWAVYGDRAGDALGWRVSRAGDVNRDFIDDVIVGAPYQTWVAQGDGAAIAYYGRPDVGPSTLPSWYAFDVGNAPGQALFGFSVAWAGDVNGDGYDDVVVGAPTRVETFSQEGRVFLYKGSSTGLASTPALMRDGQQAGALMGFAASGVGDVNGDGLSDVVIGSAMHDDNGFTNNGRLDLWLGHSPAPVGSSWSFAPSQSFAQVGWAVGPAGDVNGDGLADIVAGSDVWDGAQTDEGRAWMFLGRLNDDPLPTPSWTADGGQAFAYMGNAVTGAGDVNGDGYADVLVGLYGYDDPNPDSGAARLFLGGAAGLKSTADTSITGQGFAEFGYSVASAGDVDGDGNSDVVVGAYTYDNGQTDEGAAFVYMGSAAGLQTAPAIVLEGNQANGWFGYSVSGAGDVDGDGFGDVVVGAPVFNNPGADSGAVYVYRGGLSGITGARWDVAPAQAGAWAGWSVAGAGDVNGDGFGDVVFGALHWNSATTDEGAAFVVLGGNPNPLPATQFGMGLGSSFHRMGMVVAGVGDVNGDGFSDVADGMDTWDCFAGGDCGKVYFFNGGSGGLSTAPNAQWGPEGTVPQQHLGQTVAPAGDVNGDGYADILIGGINFVRYYEGGWNNNAASPSPLWSFQTDQGASQLGTANTISTAGDVNNDGYSDVIVGAPNYLAPSDNGRAWMFLGSASGLSPTPSWTVTGGNTGARFGHAVAFAGDVNGDGYSDVILSDPFNSQVTTQNGKISIYYGNGGLGGRSFVSHQQSPQSTPARNVAPLGMIGTDLVLSFYGGGPIAAGHDGGALEIEVKPQLAPFNGTGTHLDAYGSLWYGSIFRGWYDAGIVAPLSTYKWRIRITGGRTPFFPHSRWWGMPDTSQTMTDFRSPCQGASWYRDLDGDGHGDPNVSSFSCQAPPGYSANGDDCDDTSAARYPGNPEICDALDNNCDALVDNAAPPAGSTQLGVTRSGLTATLSWSPLAGATSYDIVRGSLATLRSFAGNYTASVNGCLGNNSPGPTVSDTSVPPSGDANWYLIRGVNCGGGGSYDEGVASQSGARDAEIAASSSACP